MGAIVSLLGRRGDPVECRTIGDASVHWWRTVTPEIGDSCLCGQMQKSADNHHQADGDHCSCWCNDEKPCCACGYDGDEAVDCTGVVS